MKKLLGILMILIVTAGCDDSLVNVDYDVEFVDGGECIDDGFFEEESGKFVVLSSCVCIQHEHMLIHTQGVKNGAKLYIEADLDFKTVEDLQKRSLTVFVDEDVVFSTSHEFRDIVEIEVITEKDNPTITISYDAATEAQASVIIKDIIIQSEK